MSINFNQAEPLDNWTTYMCKIEKKSALIRSNLAIHDLAPIPNYDKKLQLTVYFQNTSNFGLPTHQENPKLLEIENSILAEIIKKEDVVYSGMIKWNNSFSIILYVNTAIKIEEKFTNLMQFKYPDYKYKSILTYDKDWKFYFEVIYPDKYQYQKIKNAKLILELEKEGFNRNNYLTIKHILNFSKLENLNNFKIEIVKNNFRIVEEVKEEDSYKLVIAKEELLDDIDKITSKLQELAEKFSAVYLEWQRV